MVAMYYVVMYTALFLAFAAAAYIVKRYSAVWCMRLGAFVNVAVIALVCAFNNQLTDLYLLFALLNGVASGIYWVAINGFTANTMGGTAMLRFQAYTNIATSAAKIILPFTLGAIIHYVSFLVATLVAAGIGVVLVAFTLLMRVKEINKSRFSIRGYVTLLRREHLVRPVVHNFFLQLSRSLFAAAGVCVTILLAINLGDSFQLGYLISAFSAATIVLLILYRLIKSRTVKNNIYLACAVAAFLLSCGLLFEVSRLTVILFQVASSVFLVVPNIETGKLQFDVMKELGQPQTSTESLVVVEFAYFIGRLAVMGLILLGCYLESFLMFKILTIILMASAILSYVIFRLWWRAYRGVIPRAPIPARRGH